MLPYLTGENKAPPHDALYWRWMAQSAIREGNWKLLRGGDREYLYDLATDPSEKQNLAALRPQDVQRLSDAITQWQLDTKTDASEPVRYARSKKK